MSDLWVPLELLLEGHKQLGRVVEPAFVDPDGMYVLGEVGVRK
jgi:hypothetical protein